MMDAYVASDIVRSEAHPDANIIWGVKFDDELEDEMRITIIATGFDKKDTVKAVEDDDVWNSMIRRRK